MNTKKKFFALSFAFAAFLLAAVPYASAIGNGDISIAPSVASNPDDPRTQSWFIYNLLPGSVQKDSVSIRNESNDVKNIKLYAVDGYTTPQGGFALRSINDPKETIGKWVVLSKSELTLKPGQEESVDFTYTVPANEEPGEYAGGIVAEDTQKIQGQGVAIVKRVGVRMYHTIPGDRNERITLISSEMKESKTGRWFEVTVENTGNVSVPLVLIEKITSSGGNLAGAANEQTITSDEQTVLPKSRVTLKTHEWQNPLIGSFTARGEIQKEGSAMSDVPEFAFTVVSPFVIGTIALVVVLAIILVTLIVRRKKSKPRRRKNK